MRKQSFGKVLFATMMMVCTVFLLTSGIVQAQCIADAECPGGRCYNGFCAAICFDVDDCDNGRFCDGEETCDLTLIPDILGIPRGLCQPGIIPCGADFCDEEAAPGYQCVECGTNADCFGGVCRLSDNVCVECKNDTHCDNGRYCDGAETCLNNVCVPGDLPCDGQFCNEITDTCRTCLGDDDCDNHRFCDGEEFCNSNNICRTRNIPCASEFCNETTTTCRECNIDADCFGGVCDVAVKLCVECMTDDDCNNTRFCDGEETCIAGECVPGDLPCPGDYCDEDALAGEECLKCLGDADCFGGVCVNNECADCWDDDDCDNHRFCDGEEFCNSNNICRTRNIPCASEFCNEATTTCRECNIDADCFGGVCVENKCAECTNAREDCSNGLYCDGFEKCKDGVCQDGIPRCAGGFCDEEGNTCYECKEDPDCFGGVCESNICYECRQNSDCNNKLFCDGDETCNETSGKCVLGVIPCGGEFCNETKPDGEQCLTCLEDADCHGIGVCVENACFECKDNSTCDNGYFCDGKETCNAQGECVQGTIPCAGDYCDEGKPDDEACLACLGDVDCFGGGRCINNVCFECRYEADCNNNLFCDGLERCEDNVCVLGENPCAGKFCDESVNACLTCLGDNDCFGGKCVKNMCVECTVNGDCNNGLFCDGVETCDAGVCRAGTAPCVGQTCDETDDTCLPCVVDSDCGEFFSCENAMCVAYPTASPQTTATLKGPGMLEIIYYPNGLDIALIKLMRTTEKSTVTITSKLKDFPVYLNGLAVDGSLRSLKGKNVILNGTLTATGGIDKIQIKGAETGCSIEAPWIDTVSIAGDFSCDMMLTGAGSPKTWFTLGKLSIKGRLSDSALLITGDVGSANVGDWGAGSTLAVGVEAGLDGKFFTNDDVATEGELGNYKFKEYETFNDGEAFGIIAHEFKNPKTLLPFNDDDFHIWQGK